jgi:hypothetical protein
MPQIADATLAMLIERVNHLVDTQSELKGMVAAQSQQLGAIPVMQSQLTELNDKVNRAFTSVREARTVADAAKVTGDFHANVLKVCGTLLLACLGLVGWGGKQLEAFRREDQALDRRTLLIEMKLGIPANTEGAKE